MVAKTGGPSVPESTQTGAVGVTIAQLAVERELGWIFRRIDHRDTGIDAEVEIVAAGRATGSLIALQIKCGSSYFAEPTSTGWKYRGDNDHLVYWQAHRLPVLIVLVEPKEGVAYWQLVGDPVPIHRAAKSWTIDVPRDKVINGDVGAHWVAYAWAASSEEGLFRHCFEHRDYIHFVEGGGRLFLRIDDYVAKSSRMGLWLTCRKPDGTEEELSFSTFHLPRLTPESVRLLFPWADACEDADFYAHEYRFPEHLAWDYGDEFRPHEDVEGVGEVYRYRLELTLGDLGKAYLAFVHRSKAARADANLAKAFAPRGGSSGRAG